MAKSNNIRRTLKCLKTCVMIFSLFFLVACVNASEEAYNSAIQKGLDVIASEKYEKAEVYFELALEEKPEDEKATAYLMQTKAYGIAQKAFNDNDFENAKVEAENVVKIKTGSESLVEKATEMLGIIGDFEALLMEFQKIYDETIILVEAGSLAEALEKADSLLNNSEINEVYFVGIKIQLEELKNNIEIKQSQLQGLAAAEDLAAGPSGDEILPNITNGGMTYDDLRNSNSEDNPLGNWKLEAENYYAKTIENLSNQEIHDYLVNTYGSADEKFEQMATGQTTTEAQPSSLSEDELRTYAKSYVDNWNGYDNTIMEESWKEIDGVEVKYYIFQDGPTQHIVGVYVNPDTGAVTGDYGGIQY
ncbi:hypothetical protein B0533_04720 [Sedimentibacter sp. SX930]|nr:hypothetical protein B0533_04720 [Sedimentibacter sp. SX930]